MEKREVELLYGLLYGGNEIRMKEEVGKLWKIQNGECDEISLTNW